jgi:hypothetical protein
VEHYQVCDNILVLADVIAENGAEILCQLRRHSLASFIGHGFSFRDVFAPLIMRPAIA